MADERRTDLARKIEQSIRKTIEDAGLSPDEITVDEDGERIHISGKGWDVYLAKTHFLRIDQTDE